MDKIEESEPKDILDLLKEKLINKGESALNEPLQDEWGLLSKSVFKLFSLKNREVCLINEIIHIIEIYVLNYDDKISISKKVLEILAYS
jgi:hypothetical protein